MKKTNALILSIFALSIFAAELSQARPRLNPLPRVPAPHRPWMPSPVTPPVGIRYESLGNYRAEKIAVNKVFRLNYGATAVRFLVIKNTVIVNSAYAQLDSGELVPLNITGTYSNGAAISAGLPTYRGQNIQSLQIEVVSPILGSRGEYSLEVGYGAVTPRPRPPRPLPPPPPRPLPPPPPVYDSCEIEYLSSSNYYYVTRNGSRIGNFQNSYESAKRELNSLVNSRVCLQAYATESCGLEFLGSSNYYYVTKNGNRFAGFTSDLDTALRTQNEMIYDGTCLPPVPTQRCSIEYMSSYNYYYVERGSERVSRFSTDHRATSYILDDLVRSGNCY